MITNRKTLQMFLDADKFALGKTRKFPSYKDSIWRFERALRFYEYYRNTGKKMMCLIYAWLLHCRGERLGFSISGNVFGPGLRINHGGLLVVNAKVKVGKWCDIHQGVNIGENGYYDENGNAISEVPIIGNYVFIGPGAKIFGKANIGDRVRVGANAVVNKDVQEGKLVLGNPQIEKEPKKELLTIASRKFEQSFLEKYPQYKGML